MLTSILITPRYRASRHVVALVLPQGSVEPVLVVKIPRLPGDVAALAREALALSAVQEGRRARLETVPQLVALEAYRGRTVLVETALPGTPLTPADVRRDRARCVAAIEEWLADLQQAPVTPMTESRFEELLGHPLRRFRDAFERHGEEARLVSATLELLEPLRTSGIPSAFEHGDVAEPNLMWLSGRRIGAVDWELAEPRGLPGHDLLHFLSYAALARRRADTMSARAQAFAEAFARPDGWARSAIERHADRLGLERGLLTPLFVACWARYAVSLLDRVGGGTATPALGDWLRDSRYSVFWRHSVDKIDAFRW